MGNPGHLRDTLTAYDLAHKIDVLVQLGYTHRETAEILKVKVQDVSDTAIRYHIKYQPEMEFHEIAEVLGISTQSARLAYRSALEKMQQIIGNDSALDEYLHQHIEEFDKVHLSPEQEYHF